jgi:ABC-type nitrate/sulfonate/bicarbonate transport system ATPase subunit
MLTILGPSGSGKTTMLKVVAGFELPDEGTVQLAGRDVTFAPPAVMDKLFTFAVLPPDVDRLYTRLWTKLKTGK